MNPEENKLQNIENQEAKSSQAKEPGTYSFSAQTESATPWLKAGEHFHFEDMSPVARFWGHLKTVLRHKMYVADGCFKVGLLRQGIFHDVSKFSPTEFGVGIKYFDGHRSPNAIERLLNEGLTTAWLHHKGRNKHHFEYWIDYSIRPGMMVYGNRMPMKYLVEMVCDRRAACMAYNKENYNSGSAWDHYQITKHKVIMDYDTRLVLENALWIMKTEGEDAGFKFLRKLLKITRGRDYTAKSLGLSEVDPGKIS